MTGETTEQRARETAQAAAGKLAWRNTAESPRCIDRMTAVILAALQAEREQATQEALERACAVFDDYLAQYPTDIFPDPVPRNAHGPTKDSCAAQALRVLLPLVKAEVRRAMEAGAQEPKPE